MQARAIVIGQRAKIGGKEIVVARVFITGSADGLGRRPARPEARDQRCTGYALKPAAYALNFTSVLPAQLLRFLIFEACHIHAGTAVR